MAFEGRRSVYEMVRAPLWILAGVLLGIATAASFVFFAWVGPVIVLTPVVIAVIVSEYAKRRT
ncbi:MAG: hypothetical protein RLZZ283_175 [Candidatus Parcubacteria bacterium]|jgi:cobalamin synthase